MTKAIIMSQRGDTKYYKDVDIMIFNGMNNKILEIMSKSIAYDLLGRVSLIHVCAI